MVETLQEWLVTHLCALFSGSIVITIVCLHATLSVYFSQFPSLVGT